MIEIEYTLPGMETRIRPFGFKRRAAEAFMEKILAKFPKAKITWYE